jgi:hypothetical protein
MPPTEPGADRMEAGLMAFRQIPHESPLPRHLGQAFPVQAEQLMKNHALPSFEAQAFRQATLPPDKSPGVLQQARPTPP